MTNNTQNLVLLGLLALIVGMVAGHFIFPITNTVDKEKIVPGSTVEVERIVNNTVEVEVANADLFLDAAIAEVYEELGDEDDFLTCGRVEYDEDEIELSRVDEWSYNWVDSDEYNVIFEGKFKFDDNSEERVCRESRTYKVTFEEDEEPEVRLITTPATH